MQIHFRIVETVYVKGRPLLVAVKIPGNERTSAPIRRANVDVVPLSRIVARYRIKTPARVPVANKDFRSATFRIDCRYTGAAVDTYEYFHRPSPASIRKLQIMLQRRAAYP